MTRAERAEGYGIGRSVAGQGHRVGKSRGGFFARLKAWPGIMGTRVTGSVAWMVVLAALAIVGVFFLVIRFVSHFDDGHQTTLQTSGNLVEGIGTIAAFSLAMWTFRRQSDLTNNELQLNREQLADARERERRAQANRVSVWIEMSDSVKHPQLLTDPERAEVEEWDEHMAMDGWVRVRSDPPEWRHSAYGVKQLNDGKGLDRPYPHWPMRLLCYRNTGLQPIFDAELEIRARRGGPTVSRVSLGTVPPHEQPVIARLDVGLDAHDAQHQADGVTPYAVLRFRDAGGLSWQLDSTGHLEQLVPRDRTGS